MCVGKRSSSAVLSNQMSIGTQVVPRIIAIIYLQLVQIKAFNNRENNGFQLEYSEAQQNSYYAY